MRIQSLLLAIWITGCAAKGIDVDPQETRTAPSERVTSTKSVALDDERSGLLARLDASGLQLGPVTTVSSSAAFDTQIASAAFAEATGSTFTTEWAGPRFHLASETHQAFYDIESGLLSVADTADYELGLAHAPDAQFLAGATALFTAIAADASEAEIDLKHLGTTAREVGASSNSAEARLGTKVFAMRRLGGLRVAGNRMVASYKTDGTLRTMRGLWPAIDLAHSQLTSTLTQTQAVARAVDTLIEVGARGDGTEPIVLESFYELRPGGTGLIAVLRGSAIRQSVNGEGMAGRIQRHDFDL